MKVFYNADIFYFTAPKMYFYTEIKICSICSKEMWLHVYIVCIVIACVHCIFNAFWNKRIDRHIIDPLITVIFQAPKMIQRQPRSLFLRCTRSKTKTKTKASTLTSPVPPTRRTSAWSSQLWKTPSSDTTSKSSTWFKILILEDKSGPALFCWVDLALALALRCSLVD